MEAIKIYKDQDVMFVDLSYYVFYRYYATASWSRRQEDEVDHKTFMKMYDRQFEKVLTELYLKHNIDPACVYLVRDSPRESLWRNKFLDCYKANRNERMDNNDIFKHTFNNVLPLVIKKHGYQVIIAEELEADDIIGLLTKKIRDLGGENSIIIITNDNDYIQVLDCEKTKVFNLQGIELKDRIGCNAKTYLKQKIILGDKSDNISSIAKKVGEKTAAKLAGSQELLEAFFEKNEGSKEKYELNRLLIDFDCIPDVYRKRLDSIVTIT